ncbi:MAG: Hsp33 family molecular chaperone [Pseudomonadota bacterium]
MTQTQPIDPAAGGERPTDDLVLPFQVGESAVRGRLARLGDVVDDVLRRQNLPAPVAELVGEATALVAMLGSSLKFDGRLTLQAQGDGPVPMLVADYAAGGGVRATASLADGAEAALREAGADRGLAALLGKGHMAMTIDQGAEMERYQGVTPIEGDSLSEAAIGYFNQSEQIPTVLRLAVGRVSRPGAEEVWRAGGVMVQFMPGEGGTRERGEEVVLADDDQEAWDRASALMQTTETDELLDPGLAAEQLLYRLYHEDGVRVFDPVEASFFCSCSRQKIASVLARYEPHEIADMAEDGVITASCDFCRTEYRFDAEGAGAL